MATLIGFLGSPTAYAEDKVASLNLELELPQENTLNIQRNGLYKPVHKLEVSQLAAFDAKGFEQILVIYATYRSLAKAYPLLAESIAIANQKLRHMNTKIYSLETSITDLNYALETSEMARDLTERIYIETNDAYKSELRKQKVRNIFLVTGTGVGAVAVGFVLGWFLSK